MNLSQLLPNRQTIRLQEYDYSSQGLYFVTICVQNKECLFGNVVEGQETENTDVGAGLCSAHHPMIELSALGRIIYDEWMMLTKRFPNVSLHEFVIMPNHFHAILEVTDNSIEQNTEQTIDKRAEQSPAPTTALGDIICAFKSITTKKCNQLQNTPGRTLWQRNYYEHIIRHHRSLISIAHYITHNPATWAWDDYYTN